MIKKIRAWMVTALLVAITIQVLWWTVEPFIPYLIVGLVLVGIGGFVYHRKTRW